MKKLHTLRWFQNRIGKRIYRDGDGCPCNTCRLITVDGLIVGEESADPKHLFETQNDFAKCGKFLNYRDKK
jgi:hypothetical protein